VEVAGRKAVDSRVARWVRRNVGRRERRERQPDSSAIDGGDPVRPDGVEEKRTQLLNIHAV
jgi:hypothetical protein